MDQGTPAPPLVEVDRSAAKAVWGTTIGALLIIATSFPTLLKLIGAHDVIAILRYLQGADGVALSAALGLVGTLAWRLSSTVRRHFRLLIAARAADDSVAIVKGDPAPLLPSVSAFYAARVVQPTPPQRPADAPPPTRPTR